MRTTVEITDEQRAELLRLAAERGEKGFSRLVQEAIDAYLHERRADRARTQAALRVLGSLSEATAREMEATVTELRSTWR